MRIVIFFILFIHLSFAQKSEIDFIQYRFVDASVPPEYHRSFTITATKEKWHCTVDSYGKVITDSTQNMTEAWWQEINQVFKKAKLRKGKDKKEIGCTGGTQVIIKVRWDNKKELQLYEALCGAKNSGNLKGNAEMLKNVLMRN